MDFSSGNKLLNRMHCLKSNSTCKMGLTVIVTLERVVNP
jgi:hypothetical protein